MGAGASAQTVQEHLDKQDALIKRLQVAVEKQGATVEGTFQDGEPERVKVDGELEREIEAEQISISRLQQAPNKPDPEVRAEEADTPDAASKEFTKEALESKPWLAGMAPPSDFKKAADGDAAPAVALELEHVYGCPKGRNALALKNDTTVLYYTGSVGVIHDLDKNKQTFNAKCHTDSILCLAYHAGTNTVATGQQGKGPQAFISVWDATDGSVKGKIAGFHTRAVTALGFDSTGETIGCAGLDDDNSVSVCDWKRGRKLASHGTGAGQILALRYEPGSSESFVMVGSEKIGFGYIGKDEVLSCTPAKLGKAGKLQTFVSIGFSSGNTVVGTGGGELYIFGSSRCLTKVVDAHNGPVTSIAEMGTDIVTGSQDGFVSVWDPTMRRSRQYNLTAGGKKNRVHCVSAAGDSIAALGANGTIYKISAAKGVEVAVTAHHGDLTTEGCQGELWAIGADPKGQRLASVCDDAVLRVWDIASHTCVGSVEIGPGAARSLAWSPDGRWIVVGFLQGSLAVFNAETMVEELRMRKRRRRIQCLAFAPGGKYLAVGSAESTVDIYSVESDFKRVGILKGNQSVVMELDWCSHAKFLKTTSQDYEVLYFDTTALDDSKCELFSPEGADKQKFFQEVKWASSNSYLGWDVQGIWPSRDFDSSEINAVRRSHDDKHLATADIFGHVKVFRYPAIGGGYDENGNLTRRPCCRYESSCPTATMVAWSTDDQYLFSTGGSNFSIFQWKMVYEK